MEGTAHAGLEVAVQDVNTAELRKIAGMFAHGDNRLVVAARSCHGPEPGQAIGDHLATGCQMLH